MTELFSAGENGPSEAGEESLPGIADLTADDLRAQFRRDLSAALAAQSEWRTEARELYDLVAGHQWPEEDLAVMREQKRPAVTFNLAGKFIDALAGLQANNRQDIRYIPREPGDTARNDILTGAAEWARDLCDAGDEESDAFHDAVLTGIGWMEWFLDEESGHGPLPAGERRDPLEMWYDPAARRRGLTDARWVCRVKAMSRAEYRERFGELPDTDVGWLGFALVDEDQGGLKVVEARQDYPLPGDSSGALPGGGRIPVADYQFWRRERGVRVTAAVLAGQAPQTRVFTPRQWVAMEPLLREQGVGFEAVPVIERVYYRCILTPAGVVQAGRSPWQKGFTFHAITGKRDRNRHSWYGIGRVIRDPQMWTNKFFSSVLFSVITNAKGGLLAEEGAFTDQNEAEDSWAMPNAITWAADGAVAGGRIMPKPHAAYPDGMDRLMQFSIDALPGVTGLNLELLGLADRMQPGVVEAQRKQSAMTIVSWAFDSMHRYYRSAGRQIADYIADYVPEGTLVRISSDRGQQYVPLVKDKSAIPYDVVVDDAPASPNQKERIWAILDALLPKLLQAGIPLPKALIDYVPLPADLVNAWKQEMQPDPQQHALREREAQASVAVSEAVVAEKQAGARLKAAQARKAEVEAGLGQIEVVSALSQVVAGGGSRPQVRDQENDVDGAVGRSG